MLKFRRRARVLNWRLSLRRIAIHLVLLVALPGIVTAQDVNLVSDVHVGTEPASAFENRAVALGPLALFPAYSAVHGIELFVTDGTEAGTQLLVDVFPGPDFGVEELEPAVLGGNLLFAADDGVHGVELWTTDGTAAGTHLLVDILAGQQGSSPSSFYSDGTTVFFSVNDDGTGPGLWKTDGTGAGTELVWDGVANPLISAGGLLFFQGFGADGPELFASNGTGAGTYQVKDIRPGSSGALINQFVALGSTLLFTANDGTHGIELWRSDGTEAGTQMIKDINATGSSSPAPLGIVGTDLLFSADDGIEGRELWKTDGGSAVRITTLSGTVGTDGAVLNGRVYFAAEDGADGFELWRSNGQLSGTGQVADINVGSGDSGPDDFVALDNRIFFTAEDDVHGLEPWVTNGATTQLVADIDGGDEDSVDDFSFSTPLTGDRLLFPARIGTQTNLWVTDGSALGTVQLTDGQAPKSSLPRSLVTWQGDVAFLAKFEEEREGFVTTDGTQAGTEVSDFLAPDMDDENEAGAMIEWGGKLFITNKDTNGFPEVDLWTWDGTTAVEVASDFGSSFGFGPERLHAAESAMVFVDAGRLHRSDGSVVGAAENGEIPGAPLLCLLSPRYQLVVLQDWVLFAGDNALSGDCELWRVDLADNSSTLVKDFDPVAKSSPAFIGTYQGKAILRLNLGAAAGELWITDGTATGTTLLAASGFEAFDAAGGETASEFLFSNYDVFTQRADIWTTDGTAGGTVLVKDLSGERFLIFLEAVDSGAYFWGLSGVWFSDGTAAGTVLVAPGVQQLQAWTTRGEDLIFAATLNAGAGRELFLVRGSEAIFEPLPEIEPGAAGSTVEEALVVGDTLYVSAFRADVGTELFSLDLSAFPMMSALFSDGFESGDTSAWLSVP